MNLNFKSFNTLELALLWANLHSMQTCDIRIVLEEFHSFWSSENAHYSNDDEACENYWKCYKRCAEKVIKEGFIGECQMLNCDPILTVLEFDL